jgi:inositol 3-alpha-galactosyltransferase
VKYGCGKIEFKILAAMEESITLLPKQAWVTLVTKASYLPGAILLSYSPQKYNSNYYLIILTSHLPSAIIAILKEECDISNADHFPINSLTPPPENTPSFASRFEDTWTKLHIFELYKYGCEKLVFLDADMLVRFNIDELFSFDLPNNRIAANHVCCCNLDHNPWARSDWNENNCPYTGLLPDNQPAAVPDRSQVMNGAKITHTLLNSGIFILSPSNSNGMTS